ncbi:MAG: hypothetical protein J6T98_05175, partial [Salinivirgaceae bacterium]|nr:hypothetical protein [Salinivirgaceae bacterium]
MADDNDKNGGDSIRELLDKLKLQAPELYSGIESYIEANDIALRNAENKVATANANLAELQSLCDLSNMYAVTLAKTAESGNRLLQWTIVSATPATKRLFGSSNCKGHKLADFINVSHEPELPENIDDNYSDTFELSPIDSKMHLSINVIGMANGSVACNIT